MTPLFTQLTVHWPQWMHGTVLAGKWPSWSKTVWTSRQTKTHSVQRSQFIGKYWIAGLSFANGMWLGPFGVSGAGFIQLNWASAVRAAAVSPVKTEV